MAALTADAEVIYDPESHPIRRQVKVAGADTFFRGALIHQAAATGKALATAAETDVALGVCDQNLVAAAVDELLWVWMTGVFFFTGMTVADEDLGDMFSATAGSDNPADLIINGAATPSGFGTVIGVESGGLWIDIANRSTPVNT